MDRLRRSNEGFTLLELVIAIGLAAVVLLSASNLLINFGTFSADVVKSEASLMGTALGTFEEITAKITAANQVAINPDVPLTPYPTPPPANATGCAAASCIQIRVDPATGTPSTFTPSVFTDDTIYTFWKDGTQLKYRTKAGAAAESAVSVIADGITLLSFTRKVDGSVTDMNAILVILEAQSASGPKGEMSKEHLETTATMRSRSAN